MKLPVSSFFLPLWNNEIKWYVGLTKFLTANTETGNVKFDKFNSYQLKIWKDSRLAEIQGFWRFGKIFGPIIVTKSLRED